METLSAAVLITVCSWSLLLLDFPCLSKPCLLSMMKNCHEQTWTAFVYRADHSGQPLWTANVTDSAEKCLNDAGEHIVTARGGGYAVYVDSGTLGKPGTGGNFGLVVLNSDTSKVL